MKTKQNCINRVQVGYYRGDEKKFRGVVFTTKDGRRFEVGTNGDPKTTLKEPVNFGSGCLSGIFGHMKEQTKIVSQNQISQRKENIMSLGFFHNDMYMVPSTNQIKEITGYWEFVQSGQEIENGIEKSILSSSGKTLSNSKTKGFSVSKSVSVGFTLGLPGLVSLATEYTHSRSDFQSRSIQSQVTSQLQEGAVQKCGSKCGDGSRRMMLYQWNYDIKTTNTKLQEMKAKTCHYSCVPNSINKLPRCEPDNCLDDYCSVCRNNKITKRKSSKKEKGKNKNKSSKKKNKSRKMVEEMLFRSMLQDELYSLSLYSNLMQEQLVHQVRYMI